MEVCLQQGSSTALVLTLEGSTLHAANVGDSGFMVVRNGQAVFRSPTQQKRFNFPFQLACGEMGDPPSCAEVGLHAAPSACSPLLFSCNAAVKCCGSAAGKGRYLRFAQRHCNTACAWL